MPSTLNDRGRLSFNTESMQDTFIYDALPGSGYIRLFLLLPGSSDQPISGRLVTVDIDDSPHYEAISYVWGDPTDTCTIICNQFSISVTRNLYNALKKFRYFSHVSRLLWADAICINQADFNERGHQVQLMRSIYAKADHVLVWLGLGTPERTQTAFSMLRDLSDSGLTRLVRNINRDPVIAMQDILDREWFERIWVLQEVGVATSVIFCCGHFRINWDVLYRGFFNVNDIHRLGEESRERLDVEKVFRIFKFFQFNRPRSSIMFNVFHLLNEARTYLASDPRDKVYALLGHPLFQQDDGSEFVPIDYSQTRDQVYLTVAKRLLKEPYGLPQLLSCVENSVKDWLQLSWVPRWDLNRDTKQFDFTRTKFSAGGSAASNAKFVLFDVPGILIAEGTEVDSISWCSRTFLPKELPENFQRLAMPKVLKDILIMVSECRFEVESVNNRLARQKNLLNNLAHTLAALSNKRQLAMHETLIIYLANSFDNGVQVLDRCFPGLLATYSWSSMKSHDINFTQKIKQWSENRRFFITERGYFGLGPNVIEPGDVVVVLTGVNVPQVVRPVGQDFRLRGECHVHGIMHGEAFESGVERKTFFIR